MSKTLTLDDVETLAHRRLVRAGASSEAASSVARSTRRAERDGLRSHGLLYVPIYAEHLECGKVATDAVPAVTTPRPAAICVDAGNGFAHPAIDAGWAALTDASRTCGVAALSIKNSYNCGILGHHAERLAEDGLIGLCFTHAPASIAPTGGKRPVIGTNPLALAVPDGEGGARLVLDQSASAIAKSEILLRSREGRSIEPGWALDADGKPTTDADAALEGSMVPAGGQKGFGVGLMVEIFAAALTGANLSTEASPFSGPKGGPPGTGQFFLAVDPSAFAGDGFAASMDRLIASIEEQEGARLPGQRRMDNRRRIEAAGVIVDDDLLARIEGEDA
ncbi:Ldh family oxidoreductase [Jannaschia sp. S6380]|uniref:Ldh family oxidoreductase n=1 Tax=Jannaschia sp. S6380 TaxID=2926408 RepID=UPI001FF57996|nr:Ldh family oxidoreductase [Jannaschia sp. S6380]MCK0168291.1 Ldh family oxidoreductase [Jannaschia sp. S6380]